MESPDAINSATNVDRRSVVQFGATAEQQKASNTPFNGYILGDSDQAWPFQKVNISPITAAPAAKAVAKRKKRVAWSKVEDDYLIIAVKKNGGRDPRWPQIAVQLTETFGVPRKGKQCRERWLNHLRPDIKKGKWTEQEEVMIEYFHKNFGAKWSTMAKLMKNRTDNDIKNKWYSMKRARERKTVAVSKVSITNEKNVGIPRAEHFQASGWTTMGEIPTNTQQRIGKIPEFATMKAHPLLYSTENNISQKITEYGRDENSPDLQKIYQYQV